MLMLIEQYPLVKQDSTEGKQLASVQPLDWHLASPLEDLFEQAVERFDGLGAPFMEEPSARYAPIGRRIDPPTGSYPFPVVQGAVGAPRRRMVVLSAEDLAKLQREFPPQRRGHVMRGRVGGGELGGERNPSPADRHCQRPLPAIPPALPARLAPSRFGVDAGMRHSPWRARLLVPYATTGTPRRAVSRRPRAWRGPGGQDLHQRPPQAANQPRQRRRPALPPALPGAPARPATW